MYTTPYQDMKSKIDTVFEENRFYWPYLTISPVEFKEALYDFVLHMKLRFINHYDVLVHSKKYKEIMGTCPNNPVLLRQIFKATENPGFKLRRQISEEKGIISARTIQTAFHPTDNMDARGEAEWNLSQVYKFLFKFFDFNYTIETYLPIMRSLLYKRSDKVLAIIIQAAWFTLLSTGGEFGGMHSCAFVRCGGNYFFYDDNTGLFPINIRDFDFNFIMNSGTVSGILLNVKDGKCCFYSGYLDIKKPDKLLVYEEDNTWKPLGLEKLNLFRFGLSFYLLSCITEKPTTTGWCDGFYDATIGRCFTRRRGTGGTQRKRKHGRKTRCTKRTRRSRRKRSAKK